MSRYNLSFCKEIDLNRRNGETTDQNEQGISNIIELSFAQRHQIANTLLTVARIAYLSSDVIISVQPAIGTDSEFSSHLNRYAGRKDSSLVAQSADTVPEVSLLYSNLPLPRALRKISGLF
jgi:hypothetical protein